MTLNDNWNICEEDGAFQKIQDLESGLFGLVYNGKVVCEPVCTEVTRLQNSWYIRSKENEGWYNLITGTFTRTSFQMDECDEELEDGSVVTYELGKGYGYINYSGIRIFENQYDCIHKWHRCDVVEVRKGGIVKYFDTNGYEILKNVKYIPLANDYESPYYYGEPMTNIVQTVDTTNNAIGDDFCTWYGVRAGLTRRTKSDHIKFLKSIANVRNLSNKAKRNFLRRFTYLYECYAVQSKPATKHPVYDCLKQLLERDAFESSWGWIIVIVLPHEPTLEEKREIDWLFRCIAEDECESFDRVSYGSDENLKEGAIVYATHYFQDDGGRSAHYHDETDIDMYTSIDDIKKEIETRGYKRSDLNQALAHIFWDTINWNKYKALAEWLIDNGATIPNNIFGRFNLWYDCEEDMIKWLLKPEYSRFSININHAVLSKTILDKAFEMKTENDSVKRSIIEVLTKHGAKTYKQKRTEESMKYGFDTSISFKSPD